MKTIKIVFTVLLLSITYQFAAAQSSCNGNKVQMSIGSKGCGCTCKKKCVAPGDVQTYLNNGWHYGTCFGSCCWIRTAEDESADETTLSEIYPNPASGSVTIAFMLSQPGEVILEVYDITGRYITTIVRDNFDGESSEITWDASKVNPGIYFLKMNAGSFSAMKKISVIR